MNGYIERTLLNKRLAYVAQQSQNKSRSHESGADGSYDDHDLRYRRKSRNNNNPRTGYRSTSTGSRRERESKQPIFHDDSERKVPRSNRASEIVYAEPTPRISAPPTSELLYPSASASASTGTGINNGDERDDFVSSFSSGRGRTSMPTLAEIAEHRNIKGSDSDEDEDNRSNQSNRSDNFQEQDLDSRDGNLQDELAKKLGKIGLEMLEKLMAQRTSSTLSALSVGSGGGEEERKARLRTNHIHHHRSIDDPPLKSMSDLVRDPMVNELVRSIY